MGQALYRVYRSKSLDEVVCQNHIVTILQQALKTNTISHAYLFTGPRGVGKTSVARILAYSLNNSPYSDPTTAIDIIEIDAASHRGIDKIRELREQVHVAPTNSKYKIYIIDEVHMLTPESFNALLKTLEEPPQHVIFILATTEAYKLPETIISRTQRFNFKPIDKASIIEHLKKISQSEKISIDEEALDLIADHSQGSLRDALSLLDQVRNMSNPVKAEGVLNLLGLASADSINKIVSSLVDQDLAAVIAALRTMYDQGIEPPIIAKQLGIRLRSDLIDNKAELPSQQITKLLGQLIDVPASIEPDVALETLLLSTIVNSAEQHNPEKFIPTVKSAAEEQTSPKIMPEIAKPPVNKATKADEKIWEEVLAAIKDQHNTLYGIIRMAKPVWNGDKLTLLFRFVFHQKRMKEARNVSQITELIEKLSGRQVVINCIVDQSVEISSPAEAVSGNESPDIENISNIFGSAELLES